MAKKTVKKVSDAVADLSDTPTLGDDTVKEIPQESVTPEANDTQSVVATDPEVIADEPVEAELPVDDTPSADFDDAPAPVVHDPEPQRARVWPLLLGGVAAAVFGFLAARADLIDNFLPPSMRAGAEQSALAENLKSANSEIARLNGDVQNLGEEVANLPTPDTSII